MRKIARIGKKGKGSIYFTQRLVNWEYIGSGNTFTTKAIVDIYYGHAAKTELPSITDKYKSPFEITYATLFQYEDGTQRWHLKFKALKDLYLIKFTADEATVEIKETLDKNEEKEFIFEIENDSQSIQLNFTEHPVRYVQKWEIKKWPPYGYISQHEIQIDKPTIGRGSTALYLTYARYRIIRNIEETANLTLTAEKAFTFQRPISVKAWPRIGPKRNPTDLVNVVELKHKMALPWLPILESKERPATGTYGG